MEGYAVKKFKSLCELLKSKEFCIRIAETGRLSFSRNLEYGFCVSRFSPDFNFYKSKIKKRGHVIIGQVVGPESEDFEFSLSRLWLRSMEDYLENKGEEECPSIESLLEVHCHRRDYSFMPSEEDLGIIYKNWKETKTSAGMILSLKGQKYLAEALLLQPAKESMPPEAIYEEILNRVGYLDVEEIPNSEAWRIVSSIPGLIKAAFLEYRWNRKNPRLSKVAGDLNNFNFEI